ncbi:MFS transporter [Kordiimonas lipolytica]|uniref:MFS transporter n=1 Tax=Kordiimonas lipolytica TaxID=1662421 RepID=A0ABV8UAI2_9PROT|nr:MFS transporter [Kordiimonas lipolytica]
MTQYRNVILLALAQACFLATSMTMVTFAGLAGIAAAPDPKYATLPVTLSIVSTALTTAPMSIIMQRTSRRFGFRLGAAIGVLSALMMTYAVYSGSFILLCVGALMVGPFQSSAQYYRFAAAESVPADKSSRAISFVLIGGLVASFFVPTLWRFFGDLFEGVDYMGAFVFAAVVVACVFIPVAFLRPLEEAFDVGSDNAKEEDARPMGAIVRQPGFIVAVVNAALGYAMMSFVMTATPLAMEICRIGEASPEVIQQHVIAMFLPSLFTGFLIQRFGLFSILLVGHMAFAVAFMTALSGIEVMHFSVALIALGLGWNFCFVGGTTLLTRVHTQAEKGRVQGLNEFLVFSTTGVASFAAGLILNLYGWQTVNQAAFVMLVIASAITLVWGMAGQLRARRGRL